MKSKKCPKCGKVKPMNQIGYRVSTSGKPISQSHCITCRSVKPQKSKKKVSKGVIGKRRINNAHKKLAKKVF